MKMFSFFSRGRIDKWYKQEMKKLDDTYFAFVNPGGSTGESQLQVANRKSKELENAKVALRQEYRERLKAIGQKPKQDFLNNVVDEN